MGADVRGVDWMTSPNPHRHPLPNPTTQILTLTFIRTLIIGWRPCPAHDGMDLSGDGASDAGASHEYHSDHSGDSVPAHSGHDDSDDGHHDHEDDDESDDDEEGDDDDDGEHGGDGTDGEGINVPRPAEDDYEDGLQDMDMMPGDMGIGGAMQTLFVRQRSAIFGNWFLWCTSWRRQLCCLCQPLCHSAWLICLGTSWFAHFSHVMCL